MPYKKNKPEGKKFSIQNFFEYEGDFYNYTGKVFDMILVSIYWFVGCIPIITIGASFAALHISVTKSIRQNRDTITKQFWKSYKRNLIPSIPLTLIFGGALFLLLLNIGILHARMQNLVGMFFIVFYVLASVFVLICACYAFPGLSCFDMPTGWIVKLSGYMAVRYLPISLILFTMLAASYLAIYAKPFAVFVIPGVAATVASSMLETLFDRHREKKNSETEE